MRRLIDNVPSFDCSFDNGICPGWKKQLPSEMVGMAVPWKTNFGNTATINSGPSGDKSELGLGSYMFADATDILRNVFENKKIGGLDYTKTVFIIEGLKYNICGIEMNH